jgi:N-acylneuraminate cytidylyltransferase
MFMENGAFYINTVKNILDSKNRLSGKIGIYEMPEYTATEIDEPDDWIILENLMYRHILRNQKKDYRKIKLFLADVDGTLTDAGMYYSENGDELKKFNTKDGLGFRLLKEAGIKTGIITSENTKIVESRAKKLNIDYLYQGQLDGGKLSIVKAICKKENFSLDEVAYIGDDVNCIDLLSAVGFAACPADAHAQVKAIQGIVQTQLNGGDGCVREWIDIILERKP